MKLSDFYKSPKRAVTTININAQELRDAYILEFDGKPDTDEARQITKQIKADIRNAEKVERVIDHFYGKDSGIYGKIY